MTARQMKDGARFIAITSGPIARKKGKKTAIVGIIFKESTIEGMLVSRVDVDGTDSTSSISRMVSRSRFKSQVRIILLNGIAIAGLNIVEPDRLERELNAKVVLLNRRRQNAKELANALREFSRATGNSTAQRIKTVEGFAPSKITMANGFFLQSRSVEGSYLKRFAPRAFNALRISHIVSSAISKGESAGRI